MKEIRPARGRGHSKVTRLLVKALESNQRFEISIRVLREDLTEKET